MVIVVFTVILTLISAFFFQIRAIAEKNTSVQVHVKNRTDSIISISIVNQGTTIQLDQKSSSLFSIKKPEGIAKHAISKIIVKKKDGIIETFSPAIVYSGVDETETIHYWIDVSINKGTTSQIKSEISNPFSPIEKINKIEEIVMIDFLIGENSVNKESELTIQNSIALEKENQTEIRGEWPGTFNSWYNLIVIGMVIFLTVLVQFFIGHFDS